MTEQELSHLFLLTQAMVGGGQAFAELARNMSEDTTYSPEYRAACKGLLEEQKNHGEDLSAAVEALQARGFDTPEWWAGRALKWQLESRATPARRFR